MRRIWAPVSVIIAEKSIEGDLVARRLSSLQPLVRPISTPSRCDGPAMAVEPDRNNPRTAIRVATTAKISGSDQSSRESASEAQQVDGPHAAVEVNS